MSTTHKGSTPGPISRTSSFRSITAPRTAYVQDGLQNDSLGTVISANSNAESDFPGKTWTEKEKVAGKDFVSDVESMMTKEEFQSSSLEPTTSKPALDRSQSSQWHVGPAPSLPSANGDATYPEGGLKAWLVVFGSQCGMMAAFGFMNTSEYRDSIVLWPKY
jgi:hypothetical protein